MQKTSEVQIQLLIATEVEKQLGRERAVLKDAGNLALKIIASAFGLLFAIFTVFGLTTWKDIKDETKHFVTLRVDELIQQSDSEFGVKQSLNALVNRAIVSSELLTLKSIGDKKFELPTNEWARLRSWIKLESLNIQEFSDALAVLNAQSEDRKKAEANSFLSDMLNPTAELPYGWVRKQPDKRLAIMATFMHQDMGAAAVEVALSTDVSENMRIAAIQYIQKIQYAEGFDKIIQIASTSNDSTTLKYSALLTSASLRPADSRFAAEIDKLVGEKTPKSNILRTAIQILLQMWREKTAEVGITIEDSETEPQRIEISKKLLNFAFDHDVQLSQRWRQSGTQIAAMIPIGPRRFRTFSIGSVEQINELKPYWSLLKAAAETNDIARLEKLIIREDSRRGTRPTMAIEITGPKNSAIVVKDDSGNERRLSGDVASEVILMRSKSNTLLLYSTKEKRLYGTLVGFSGGGFEFSGVEMSKFGAATPNSGSIPE